MTEIKELIQTHDDYLRMILFATLAMLIITFAVNYFTERIRFPKYLPGLISLIIGVIMLAGLIPNLYLKEYLGNVVISMVAIGVGIVGLAFGMILGVLFKRPAKYEKDEKDITYEEY
ncbi:MAG: hypothetical protein GX666_11790 [Tissierellia bacterium]|nr:hypothetical protein [Tissierellia bacterium]